MKKNTILVVVAGVSLFIIVFVTVALIGKGKESLDSAGVAGTPEEATSPEVLGEDMVVTLDTSPTVVPTIAIPDLTRTPRFASWAPKDAVTRAQDSIKQLQAMLLANPTLFHEWIDLGLTFSSVGDYEGARAAYEYAGALRPANSVSFGNLGYLYAYHLKDTSKAIQFYKKAIANDPTQEYLQVQLFEVYRDIQKDPAAARTFGETCMKENPDFALTFSQLIADLNK